MKIDRKLNLVIPISDGDTSIYVHAVPLSREVFEKYFLVLSKTFTFIYTQGLNVVSGPRVAALTLRKIAEADGVWDGEAGVERGLMGEIKRLTNVICMTDQGWRPLPFEMAVKQGKLDSEIASEVENVIVFFMVASAVHLRTELPEIYSLLGGLCHALVTSLACTEYGASLPTSTPAENTGAKATRLSIPS